MRCGRRNRASARSQSRSQAAPVSREHGGHGEARDRGSQGLDVELFAGIPFPVGLPAVPAGTADARERDLPCVCPRRTIRSHRLDRESGVRSVGDPVDVGGIRGDDGVEATDGAFDHGDIDDVVVIGSGGQAPDCFGLVIGERFGEKDGRSLLIRLSTADGFAIDQADVTSPYQLGPSAVVASHRSAPP